MSELEITSVDVRLLSRSDYLKAYVKVVFNDAFVVHGIRIVEGSNGLDVEMPSRMTPDGKRLDVAHPINANTRKLIMESVLEAYYNAVAAD